jgi:hypothetical protein
MLRHLTIAERRNLDETSTKPRRNLTTAERRNLVEAERRNLVEARGRLINARRGPMPSCASDVQRATIRGRGTHSRTQTYQVVGGSAKPAQSRDPVAVRARELHARVRPACKRYEAAHRKIM